MSYKMWCGDNDEPGVNVGNATSPVDEDTSRIEQGNSYSEKLEQDLAEMLEELRQKNAASGDDETQIVDPENLPAGDETEKSQDESEIVCN